MFLFSGQKFRPKVYFVPKINLCVRSPPPPSPALSLVKKEKKKKEWWWQGNNEKIIHQKERDISSQNIYVWTWGLTCTQHTRKKPESWAALKRVRLISPGKENLCTVLLASFTQRLPSEWLEMKQVPFSFIRQSRSVCSLFHTEISKKNASEYLNLVRASCLWKKKKYSSGNVNWTEITKCISHSLSGCQQLLVTGTAISCDWT